MHTRQRFSHICYQQRTSQKSKHARLPRFYHHIDLFMKFCSTIYLMQPNHGTSNYQISKHFNKKLLRINILASQIQLCAQIMITFSQTGSHQLKIDLCFRDTNGKLCKYAMHLWKPKFSHMMISIGLKTKLQTFTNTWDDFVSPLRTQYIIMQH